MNAPPIIHDHTLLRPIGRGAYGEVWLARNVMGALRAVKVIRRDQFESDRPYEREFAGIQRYEPVSHSSSGLVHLLHIGRNEAEGYFYYVMELADNATAECRMRNAESKAVASTPHSALHVPHSYAPRTLRSDLKRLGRLPTADCLRLALDVVSGLAQLHLHDLVHRDVKPGNIIFVNGRAKLADIGLVTTHGEGRTFVGTEGYIPPEGPGSPAADLYALGIVLYEASTGYAPEKFPDVPGEWFTDPAGDDALEFHEVILKACEGQRERRYQSAEEMQADLALLQSGQSVRHVRALERRYARLRLSGFIGTTLLVCAVAAALLANYRARVAAESRAKEIVLREHAETSLARAEAAERESQQQLYAALLEQARATVLTGELGHRVRALDAVRRAGAISNTAALRGVAISALALPDLRFEREWPTTPDTTLANLDPQFARIALCRGRGSVEIRSVSDQQLLATLPASTNLAAFFALWSPDGRFFAVSRDRDSSASRRDVEVWEVASRKRVLLLRDTPWGAMSFHPKLPHIMIGQMPATAVIWNGESGEELTRHSIEGRPVVLKFAPDGEHFAALFQSTHGWVVAVHDARDGAPGTRHVFANRVRELDWHPSGRGIAVPDFSGAVHWMDAQTGETRMLGQHKSAAVRVFFSPDGEYLFSSGWDRQMICWDMRAMRRAFALSLESYAVLFRADGKQCAIFTWPNVSSKIYTFERATLHREFAEDLGGGRNYATFSADGRWLAAHGEERLAVWDLTSAGPGTAVNESANARVDFAPNGELFASRPGECFRWRVSPGTDGAAPTLERLAMSRPAGFVSLCVVSNGVVFTTSRGSTLTAFDQLASDPGTWKRTADGLAGASPDQQWLGLFRSYTPHLYVYRLPAFDRVAKLTNGTSIGRFEFSPRGDEVAVSTRGGIEFWNTATWQRTRHLANFTSLLYSPDARTFWLSTDFRTAGLHDARTAEPLLPLPPNTLPLALSRDGRHLAVSVNLRRVQVWDLAEVRLRLREAGLDWDEKQ